MGAGQSLEQYSSESKHANIVLLVLASIAVFLRGYVKTKLLGSVSAADIAMYFAYVCCQTLPEHPITTDFLTQTLLIGMIATDFICLSESADVFGGNFSKIQGLVNAEMAFDAIYAAASICSKLSVALFIIDILGFHRRVERGIVLLMLGVSTIFGIIYCAFMLNCGIHTNFFSPSICPLLHVTERLGIVWTSTNTVADATFALLCLGLIWPANMDRKSKITAGVLLCFGSLGCIASILRACAIDGWGFHSSAEGTIIINRLASIETGVTITAASFATTRPLISKILSWIKSHATPPVSVEGRGPNASNPGSGPRNDPDLLYSQSDMVTQTYPLKDGTVINVVQPARKKRFTFVFGRTGTPKLAPVSQFSALSGTLGPTTTEAADV
ncbi:hypothetical protein ANO11243_018780 [Dothideomycetidae sp. 11243]|nr:hypothetical protein ANO11243_018780 [fungal sp. No.11243]